MAELKTKATKEDVKKFISSVENVRRREDSFVLLEIFERVTKEKAILWGESIIGFGSYHYKSTRSSQEGDWPLIGFSPRKTSLSVYIMPGFTHFGSLMDKLGKFKTSVSCLYINKLDDVDLKVFI